MILRRQFITSSRRLLLPNVKPVQAICLVNAIWTFKPEWLIHILVEKMQIATTIADLTGGCFV
jgi:hypothetical protein